MLFIRGPTEVARIVDLDVRSLVSLRMSQLGDGEHYNPQAHGELIVAEPGDTLVSLEGQCGCPIASNPFDDARYPDTDFVPVCEFIEEHPACFELGFV